MPKFLFSVAAIAGLLAFAGSAQAQAPNPFGCQGQQPIFKSLFHKQPLPAFQAAPWYLYWPYNSHFQTASPMINSPYYAPPGAGYQLNPYFPQQPYGYPALPYGYDAPLYGPRMTDPRMAEPKMMEKPAELKYADPKVK